MEQRYSDMHTLLKSDANAWKYFNMLPDYVRDHISSRAGSVNTFSSLQAYAQNLLKGDI